MKEEPKISHRALKTVKTIAKLYLQALFAFVGYLTGTNPRILNETVLLIPNVYYLGIASITVVITTFFYNRSWFFETLSLYVRAVGWMFSVLETVYFGTILILPNSDLRVLFLSITLFSLVAATIATVDILTRSVEQLSSKLKESADEHRKKATWLVRTRLVTLPFLLRLSALGHIYSTPLFGASLTFGATMIVSSVFDNNLIPWRNSATSVTFAVFLLSLLLQLLARQPATIRMEKTLMKAKFSKPVLCVLSVPTLSKEEFSRVTRGPNITPSEWVDRVSAAGLEVRLAEVHGSLRDAMILNPLGESYPEEDIANMMTFTRIKKYIQSGGIFVNINGLAFWYMWNPSTRVEALTGEPFISYSALTVVEERRRIRRRHVHVLTSQLTSVFHPDEASIVDTWLLRAFGIRTTVGSQRKVNAKEAEGFHDILEDRDEINEFRSALRSESADSTLIPLLRAKYGYGPEDTGRVHECYPIAAVKHGLGYLVLIGLAMTDDRHLRLVPKTLYAIRNRMRESGTLVTQLSPS